MPVEAWCPMASEYPDERTRVRCSGVSASGRKRPELQPLWRKYGQRPVATPGKSLSDETVEQRQRMYYKCYDSGCKAKMVYDLDPGTEHPINRVTKGRHTHPIVVEERVVHRESFAEFAVGDRAQPAATSAPVGIPAPREFVGEEISGVGYKRQRVEEDRSDQRWEWHNDFQNDGGFNQAAMLVRTEDGFI
eukprot:TRINITY_DN26478_c0_g1_i2.p1 TRINITY_DN26478_c0_g1~~TRINITY_DN26478_c0_g1_i2.p1  ORF type:complete len:191 (-),score=9.53 TRINITY_DN26478_c0_g1_i2:262-834(-)